MTPTLLAVCALLAGAGPAAAEPELAPPVEPIEYVEPVERVEPRLAAHPLRALLTGVALGPSRGDLKGLAIEGYALEVSIDVRPAPQVSFPVVRLTFSPSWHETPAGLGVTAWRAGGALLWRAGPVFLGAGIGLSLSTMERATGRGRLVGLSPFGRVLAGLEGGPWNGVAPFLEGELAGEFWPHTRTLRVGLRFER